MPVIVTTSHILAVNGMRGHLALSPALPDALELGQVKPRTRLEIRLGLPALRLG